MALQEQAAQDDALTMSILYGGGGDMSGAFGMSGGLDASTLAMLAGGDSDLALQMALANGGYDPTMMAAYY